MHASPLVIFALAILFILRLKFCEYSPHFADLFRNNPLSLHCQSWFFNHHFHPIYQGIVCGQTPNTHWIQLFKNLGLYHWLVVSGAHLVFLQKLLSRFIKNSYGLWSLLLAYGFVCEMNPPITRGLITLLFHRLNTHKSLFIPTDQILLISGLCSLTLFPEWISSLSFQLSWLVALALEVTTSRFQTFFVSLFITPLVGYFSILHLLYNMILTPVLSYLLFPLALIFSFFPQWSETTNHLWEYFLKALTFLPQSQNTLSPHFANSLQPWMYLFLIHFLFIFRRNFCLFR